MKRISLFLFVLIITTGLFAQYLEVLRNSQLVKFTGVSVRTPNSSSIVFWDDSISGSANIWAQKLSTEGVPLWPTPRQITFGSDEKRISEVVLSSDGNIIVLYDQISVTDYQTRLYLQKLSPAGQVLWSADGICVGSAYYHGNNKLLVANSIGGAFVVSQPLDGVSQLNLHNYNSQGTSLLPDANLYNVPASYLTEAVPDGEGGILIKSANWNHPDGYSIHLVHINSEGDIVGSNPLIPAATFGYGSYRIVATPQNEFLLYRIEYSSLALFKFDINGNMLFPSQVNIPLIAGSAAISNASVIPSPDGGFFYCAAGSSTDNPSFITIGKLNSDGTQAWNSPVTFNESSTIQKHTITLGSDSSIWLNYASTTNSNTWDECLLKTTLISANGIPAFTPVEIGNSTIYNSSPISIAQNNKAVIVWNSRGDSTVGVSCQTISNTGILTQTPGGLSLRATLNGSASLIKTHSFSSRFVYLFNDSRNQDYPKLYFQITDSDIDRILEQDGRALNPGSLAREVYLDSIVLPNNKLALLYTISVDDNDTLYLQEISDNGQKSYPGFGLQISGSEQNYFTIAKLSTVGSDVLIAWDSTSENGQSEWISGQRIHNGMALWQVGGKTIVPSTMLYIDLRAMVGNYLIFDGVAPNWSEFSLKALAINDNGDPAPGWQSEGITITSNTLTYSNLLHSAGLMANNLTLLYNDVDADSIKLCAQMIDPSANLLLGQNGLTLGEADIYSGFHSIDAVYNNDLSFLLRRDAMPGVYLQILHPDGTTGFEGLGTYIDYAWESMQEPKLIMYPTGNYSVLWSGYENDHSSLSHRFVTAAGEIFDAQIPDLPTANAYYNQLCASSIGNVGSLAFNGNTYYDLYRGDPLTLTGVYAVRINPLPSAIDDPVTYPATLECSNYPNPFNPSTTIKYAIDKAQTVKLVIYNSKGQLVNTLVNENQDAGTHEAIWNGKDSNGNSVASGVYLYKIHAGKYSQTKKMMLMK